MLRSLPNTRSLCAVAQTLVLFSLRLMSAHTHTHIVYGPDGWHVILCWITILPYPFTRRFQTFERTLVDQNRYTHSITHSLTRTDAHTHRLRGILHEFRQQTHSLEFDDGPHGLDRTFKMGIDSHSLIGAVSHSMFSFSILPNARLNICVEHR